MRRMVQRALRDEDGKVLILALIVLVVGGLILGPLLGLMGTGLAAGQSYEVKTAELYAADAGLKDAIHWLLNGRDEAWPWEAGDTEGTWHREQALEINSNSVDVTIETLGATEDYTYKITSMAIGEGSGTTVVSVVKAPPRGTGCNFFTENMVFNNQSDPLSGTIVVVGDVKIENNYEMDAEEMFIDGNLNMENNSSLNTSIICLTGDIIMENNTEITADIHLLGDDCTITIAQPNAFIKGNIWAEGNVTIAILAGNANRPEVQGHVYAASTVTVRFGDPLAVLQGDVFAGEPPMSVVRDKAKWGDHDGCQYYLNASGDLWVSDDDGCPPQQDPPFTIGDCPELPEPEGAVVRTYEVLGYGG